MDGEIVAKCDMCGNVIEGEPSYLGKRVVCQSCYQIGLERLSKLWDVLMLPDDEFEAWLKQD